MRRQMKKDSIAIVPCSRNLIGQSALKDALASAPSVLSLPLSFLTPKTASHQ
jgi:hypothetical protein